MEPRKGEGESLRDSGDAKQGACWEQAGQNLQEQTLQCCEDSTHSKANGILEDDAGDSVCQRRDRTGCLLEATRVEELMALSGALPLVSRT